MFLFRGEYIIASSALQIGGCCLNEMNAGQIILGLAHFFSFLTEINSRERVVFTVSNHRYII